MGDRPDLLGLGVSVARTLACDRCEQREWPALESNVTRFKVRMGSRAWRCIPLGFFPFLSSKADSGAVVRTK